MAKHTTEFFRSIASFLIRPVEQELPFLFSFFLLISLSTLKVLVAGLLYPDQMDTVVFLHLSRALAISYLLACIVFYCGKRWIKVLFYAIGLTLFSVNLMVWLVFHKTFSPQIFVLFGETNCKEATEFV